MYERQGLLLPPLEEPPIDSELLASLQETRKSGGVVTPEAYKQLTVPSDKKMAKTEAWHRGEDPDLSSEHLDEVELVAQLERLREWKQELLTQDNIDPEVRQAYRWRINEDIANIHMLIASSRGDTRGFERWNTYIYGKPDEDIYRGALDWIAHDAERLLEEKNQHPAVAMAAQNVLDKLEGKRGYRELLSPDVETFEKVRQDHWRKGGYYALLLSGVDIPQANIRNEKGDVILQHVVKYNLQSNYTLADAAGSTWGVAHSTEQVERPAKYNMPWQRFVGLGLGHEIGSHLLEKVNGSLGPLALAADGLDRYEAGNEGRATIREQVLYDTFDEFGELVRWHDILRRHIAISYGTGVGEDAAQPSSKVYELINLIDVMYQSKHTPDDIELTRQKAQAKTDRLLLRVLKGPSVYLKDKVYLEGHVACWLTAAIRGPKAISDGDLGKYDISNRRHIRLLQKKQLLPDNELDD